MTQPALAQIRNIGIIAHIDAGKTTTTEHVLYYAGAKHRLGEVDAGTTDTDYDVEEQERGITIYSACIPFQWRDCTVNLIDTPGHVDFTAEVERSLRVLDGCVVVFDAQKGVEAQSETVWRQADKYAVPRLVFVNKMDVVGADFANVLQEIRERLEGRPVALTIPIGAGSIKDSPTPFHGVIDLIERKALFFDAKDDGKTIRTEKIPDDLVPAVEEHRDQLFDVLSEHDEKDRITSAYLEGKEIPTESVRLLVREQTLAHKIQPVLCGSGREHAGIQPLMDAVTYYLPSPLDRPPVTGIDPKTEKTVQRKPDPKGPFCGLVFKVVADSHGDIFFLRVYSGTLKRQSRAFNPRTGGKELVSKLYHIHADPRRGREEVPDAPAGDIVALVGLRESITGDTLCDASEPILLEPIRFAEAVVSQSIEPESSADKDKLTATMDALKREDPTFIWRLDPETGQTLMSGMGVLHLEIKRHRMERDFGLKVRVGKPYVSYRETIRAEREVWGECDRQVANERLYARLRFRFKQVQGTKPVTYLNRESTSSELAGKHEDKVVEESILSGLQSGEFGYPVTDVEASLLEAKKHVTDTTGVWHETALQIAANDAIRQALKDNVVLLEPVMRVEVTVPEEYLGPIISDLNARRAEIEKVTSRGKLSVIEAIVPLARMFDYSDKVRSLSQGRAGWTMEPQAYRPASDDTLRGLLGD
jgi:elongation factor G